MRVVSLLASATEMVCALGAGERLVGRSHECDNPSWVRRLPACSQPAFDASVSSREIDAEVRRRIRSGEPLYLIDTELIRRLQPDLVITQSHCQVCAVTPQDVQLVNARQLALSAGSLEGIFADIGLVAEALGLAARGRDLIACERRRLETVRERTAGLPRPTVVMIEWTDPLFAMGNWGPELVEIAGGELLIGRAGEYSAPIDPTQLRTADPAVLIVAPCGFSLDRALSDQPVLEQHPWWPELQAVRHGRVAFADGNLLFNRSGMTVSRTAEIIAEILHGLPSGEPAKALHWRWASSRCVTGTR
jgi:iron complex transport system substrate-binding protein